MNKNGRRGWIKPGRIVAVVDVFNGIVSDASISCWYDVTEQTDGNFENHVENYKLDEVFECLEKHAQYYFELTRPMKKNVAF